MTEQAIKDIFTNRKFGIFVHWGLYSMLGGVWKDKKTPYIAEWIMKRSRIPAKEYEQLAEKFNPSAFDPAGWIETVARAGARYFVFTAKHHDGFAMYRSKCNRYNVIDASGFNIDPIEALADQCRKRDIKFCLYYSQDQDWHHPHGTGNDWDFDPEKKDFSIYFEEKVKPQVTELLSNYGPIGLIWFDTPVQISRRHSKELFELVHRLQPDCLVNGRLGHGIGDYGQTEDNDIPAGGTGQAWEVPATMNDSWGYKTHDRNWKSPQLLLNQLIEVISKGGNYLLNIGPDGIGRIPTQSIQSAAYIGSWLKDNARAVFGTKPSPFTGDFEWGYVTESGQRLYLIITDPDAGRIELSGLRTHVKNMSLLSNQTANISFNQQILPEKSIYMLSVDIPQWQTQRPLAVEVNCGEEISADKTITQKHDGKISLEVLNSDIDSGGDFKPGTNSSIESWLKPKGSVKWSFRVLQPGRFEVSILTSMPRADGDPASPVDWEGGHKIKISAAGQTLYTEIKKDFEETRTGSHAVYAGTRAGEIAFDSPGLYELEIEPEHINAKKGLGFTLRSVLLSSLIANPRGSDKLIKANA
ncbi:Alpha-L-fucosidase [Limihaloglobus sulfuriphilus]|uniref:alpha-L-fucosidase n=1 Tax=Limihaloglobus sulfuriphilus TaxID=1851148 RepID=A0A1Q2MJC4_9BACT|nr:alpha-L-fucosidase [Limihaloglobus sulfuriphilus]AQQ72547.1 Alpha-L-fucosidase [Limihaloglobus sulfuriphilus]